MLDRTWVVVRRISAAWIGAAVVAGAITASSPAGAQEVEPAAAEEPARRDFPALFVGYQTEPAMDYGGRVVASAHDAVAGSFARIGDIGARHPGLAPVWEFPTAAALLLVQHEVLGHGARAREFGLSPSYGFGLDFSGSTGTERPPRDHTELALLPAGGAEADGVMAHRLLLDALGPDGIDGAQLPLVMMAKLDLTVYVATAPRPRPGNDEGDFTHEYRNGNDVAIYLAGRQAARLGAPAATVWDGVYEPDFDERRLDDDWKQARDAALWNLLDPSLGAAMVGYFRRHVLHGEARVQAPALRLGESARLSLGTRAALGPEEITRFLDLQAALPWAVVDVYLRDLDSGVDRSWGYGAAVHAARIGPVRISLGGDAWEEPRGTAGAGESRWNAVAEGEWRSERWGIALKVGSKSAGFFPGLPIDEGTYAGAGVIVDW
ncbi:MAG TPA: hypothetical protein VN811_02290 [Thermoanaerobaculia bacterium]|nr:hypothetical protein [Thermoanaerobaculia bacterium]